MQKSMNTFRNLTVGTKLTTFTFALVGIIFISLMLFVGHSMSALVEKRAINEITAIESGVLNMLGVFEQTVGSDASRFSKLLAASFPAAFSIDPTRTVSMNGKDVPVLKNGASDINLDFSVVDAFTANTSVSATVFVRNGADFSRVSTSVKKENGERAVGTMLDRAHPAYPLLLAGNTYSGIATLFGKPYITKYVPIKSAEGAVIGVLYVGVDISADLAGLKQRIKAITLGKTGFFYIVNASAGKDRGLLVLHPKREGENILDAKDSNGREFIKDMLEKKQGLLHYTAASDAGDKSDREKVAIHDTFAAWHWLVVGEIPASDITDDIVALDRQYIGLGIAALAIFAALLFAVVRILITLPLRRASAAAVQLAAGDLTAQLEVTTGDEIGQLLQAMNGISNSLSGVVHRIREGVDQLVTGSAEIANGNLDLSARTEQQAASLEETAASMEELTSTVKQNADNARQANQLAVSASGVAVKGGAVVDEVIATMESINTSSRKIVDIIAVIDGIAFQTNILALNAAVEAARAGEQGRGFAVVASEVRSLAQRSAAAAKEIKTLIGDSVEKVDDGSRLVATAGATMREVVGSVQRVTDIMAEITAASQEQSAGIEQVNQAIVQMDHVTQQNAALVQEALAATQSLEDQAAGLGEAVSIFRLGDGR